MNDAVARWALGVATTLSAAAVVGIVTMWWQLTDKVDAVSLQISNMQAVAPALADMRELEHGQLRQSIQLLNQDSDVLSMRIEQLAERINMLEAEHRRGTN